jgi:Mg-chelatase subunit ChlD
MKQAVSFTGRAEIYGNAYRIEVVNGDVVEIVPEHVWQHRQAMQGKRPTLGAEQTANETGELKNIKLDDVFKAKLQSVLTDNMYLRHLPKRKRGKLDMHNLWRGSVGATNLFTQKQARKGRHYNVVLLIDKSGSMAGTNLRQATETAIFLGKHFEAIGIDFSIIGFATNAEILKPINEKISKATEQALLGDRRGLGGGTDMFEGLKLAVQQLKGQKGQSLVIVISDGQTANPKEVRAILHANTDIKAFGVGIGTPITVVPQNELIRDIDQLKPVILNWLAQNIRRGA